MRSRFERLLAPRWRSVFLVCVLITLCGVAVILWARIDAGDRRADQMQDEVDRRGKAVSTLARDVRALRAQVRAGGGTPAAPDPSEAVDDLLDRIRVPAALPGARGEKGERGATGSGGAAGAGGASGPRGEPGPSGPPGPEGQDGPEGSPGPSGPPGDPGPAGADGFTGAAGPEGRSGSDGTQGVQGPRGEKGEPGPKGDPGPACPDGYSLQVPATDPDALVCRKAGAGAPAPTPAPAAVLPVLPVLRRRDPVE
ncbi:MULTISPECIES: collagen-like protein [unclassified Streptomyces]|uniref:collagen-like triple helix repeat-containing protein n=1 Tax=unclassified Streptomyces TaxID=2593676 RepID=UPI002253DE72|nr:MULTISPECIES: collagen-like protein [unclassified Streptomyces]MCX5062599.1 collagen-like protein [Streptomyces sp. NBC_00452]MCX5291793.1 collagen-like protein [Streptomyces sp. NBC_00183]